MIYWQAPGKSNEKINNNPMKTSEGKEKENVYDNRKDYLSVGSHNKN